MFGVLRSSPFQLPGISVAAYTLTLPFTVFPLFGCCDGLYRFSPAKSSMNFYFPTNFQNQGRYARKREPKSDETMPKTLGRR